MILNLASFSTTLLLSQWKTQLSLNFVYSSSKYLQNMTILAFFMIPPGSRLSSSPTQIISKSPDYSPCFQSDPSGIIYFQNKSYKIMDLLKLCYNVPFFLEKDDFSTRPYMIFQGSSRILVSYYIAPLHFRHTSILKAQRYSRHVPSSGSLHYKIVKQTDSGFGVDAQADPGGPLEP